MLLGISQLSPILMNKSHAQSTSLPRAHTHTHSPLDQFCFSLYSKYSLTFNEEEEEKKTLEVETHIGFCTLIKGQAAQTRGFGCTLRSVEYTD